MPFVIVHMFRESRVSSPSFSSLPKGLMTVFDAILTSRQTCLKTCLPSPQHGVENRDKAYLQRRSPGNLVGVGSISSRCSGNGPALLPRKDSLEEQRPDSRERRKSSLGWGFLGIQMYFCTFYDLRGKSGS